MFLVDITNFIDDFISLMATGVTECFNILDGITFHGFSLLDFSLSIVLITLGLTLFINVVRVSGRTARAESGRRK